MFKILSLSPESRALYFFKTSRNPIIVSCWGRRGCINHSFGYLDNVLSFGFFYYSTEYRHMKYVQIFRVVPGPWGPFSFGPWSQSNFSWWSLVLGTIWRNVPGPWDHLAKYPWFRDPHAESQSSSVFILLQINFTQIFLRVDPSTHGRIIRTLRRLRMKDL